MASYHAQSGSLDGAGAAVVMEASDPEPAGKLAGGATTKGIHACISLHMLPTVR